MRRGGPREKRTLGWRGQEQHRARSGGLSQHNVVGVGRCRRQLACSPAASTKSARSPLLSTRAAAGAGCTGCPSTAINVTLCRCTATATAQLDMPPTARKRYRLPVRTVSTAALPVVANDSPFTWVENRGGVGWLVVSGIGVNGVRTVASLRLTQNMPRPVHAPWPGCPAACPPRPAAPRPARAHLCSKPGRIRHVQARAHSHARAAAPLRRQLRRHRRAKHICQQQQVLVCVVQLG